MMETKFLLRYADVEGVAPYWEHLGRPPLTTPKSNRLFFAFLGRHNAQLIRWALDNGAGIDVPERPGYNAPLLYAMQDFCEDETFFGLLGLLLDRGASLFNLDGKGSNALHCALERRERAAGCVKAVLAKLTAANKHALLESAGDDGMTPLQKLADRCGPGGDIADGDAQSIVSMLADAGVSFSSISTDVEDIAAVVARLAEVGKERREAERAIAEASMTSQDFVERCSVADAVARWEALGRPPLTTPRRNLFMCYAVAFRKPDLIQWALDNGADLNARVDPRDPSSARPLGTAFEIEGEIAEHHERYAMAQFLLSKGAQIADILGPKSALHVAAQMFAPPSIFRAILRVAKESDCMSVLEVRCDETGDTPLHTLIRASPHHDHAEGLELLAILVEAGVFVSAKTRKGLTPYQLATKKQAMHLLPALLATGAEGVSKMDAEFAQTCSLEEAQQRWESLGCPSLTADDNNEFLCALVSSRTIELVQWAMQNGAAADAPDKRGEKMPLSFAIERTDDEQNTAIAELLISMGAGLSGLDERGSNAVHAFLRNVAAPLETLQAILFAMHEFDIVEIVNESDKNGDTPLHVLIRTCAPGAGRDENQAVAILAVLELIGIAVDSLTRDGQSPVELATSFGAPALAAALSVLLAKSSALDRENEFLDACRSASLDTIRGMLMERGSIPISPAEHNMFFCALVSSRPVEFAAWALEVGADVNAPMSASGLTTPLGFAIDYQGEDLDNASALVELLLAKGARITDLNGHGLHALNLSVSVQPGDARIVRLICEHLKSTLQLDLLEAASASGNTPLTQLIRGCFPGNERTDAHGAQMLSVLLEHGVKLTTCSPEGYQPLHLACLVKAPIMVAMLLKAGADPYAATQDGKKFLALHVATEHNAPLVVETLLRAGVRDREAVCGDGSKTTAVQLAEEYGFDEVLKCFAK